MAKDFILAIDQGTTGSTALVVDMTNSASVIGRHTVDFAQHYPKVGWVEHDLDEIWSSVAGAVVQAMEKARAVRSDFRPELLQAIGITNQRETLCIFERSTIRPLGRALVWQDKRSVGIVERLKKSGYESEFRRQTGLVLDPYFSGTKITWVMEEAPEIAAQMKAGRAFLGTIDTFLIAKLTGGIAFVTEASNASRTLAYDIHKGRWDQGLISLLGGAPVSCFPEVLDSAGLFGKTQGLSFLPSGIPITGALGDQQAALAGQTCFAAGEAKCTYGTGAFLLANLGDQPRQSRHGMLTTVAWQLGGKRTYAFEGSSFIAGAVVQFLRDQLQLFAHAKETAALANDAQGAPEVYFVPALSGLGAPYWDPKAQGAIFGLTRGTSKGQIVRAALEGIAFQVAELAEAMAQDLGAELSVLRVDGGAAQNDLLMQAQADFAALSVDRPQNLETTAFGASLFAGLGAGLYSDLAELRSVRLTEHLFKPAFEKQKVAEQRRGWKRAVSAVQVFAGSSQ